MADGVAHHAGHVVHRRSLADLVAVRIPAYPR